MKKYIVNTLLLLSLISCRDIESNDSVNVNRDYIESIQIEDLFSDVKYLELEYNDEYPIGNIRKVVAVDDILYMAANSKLFQYTLDGKFISCISRKGRGPQEYINIADFAVNDGYIYIIDRNNKLLKYSTDNKFIASIDLPFYVATIYVEEDVIVLSSAYQNQGDKFRLYSTEELKSIGSFEPINPVEITYRHFFGQSNFYTYNDVLCFHEPLNDNLFEIDLKNRRFDKRYSVDIFGRKAPADFWRKEYESVMDINNKLKARGYCYGLPIFAESKESILFTYIEDGKYRMCLHNKRKNKSVQFENIKLDTDQPVLSVAETTFCFDSDESQFIVIPDTYFWNEDGSRLGKGILPQCSNTGNPILAIVKL